MSGGTFESSVLSLKEALNIINATRVQDINTIRTLYVALSKVAEASKEAAQADLVANSNLNVLEEIFSGKHLQLNKGLQVLVVSIYSTVLSSTPGYAVRNVIGNLINVCSSKTVTGTSRECAAMVIGAVIEKRSFDCGSMVNDVVACMSKLVKSSDHGMKLAGIQSLTRLVVGAGARINDCHMEIVKLATKSIGDKSADIRNAVAILVTEIAKVSSGCASVSIELLLAPVIRGLEDESSAVQETCAFSTAVILNEQIESYLEEQEQAKIGQARGGASEAEAESSRSRFAPSRGSLAKLKDMTSVSQRKLIEEYDFKSVIRHLIKQIVKSNSSLRSCYVMSLLHLVRIRILTLDKVDFEWLVLNIIGIIHDPLVATLSYEDVVYFRSRLAFLLRTAITSNLTENAQISFAVLLSQFVTSTESKTEHELQLALGELGHVVTALGEAAISVVDDVRASAMIQLRNASFGVRAAAAYVLASLATVIPAVAARYLREALENASSQVKLLTAYDGSEQSSHYHDLFTDSMHASSSSSSSSASQSKRKNPKEMERLQRMYCFHGHTLVISIFLKNEQWLPTGLPKELVMDVFDFGLELLKQDIMTAPSSVRHVTCSVIRAGSLIVSSCLNLGYDMVRSRIPILLRYCTDLLVVTTSGSANPPASESPSATTSASSSSLSTSANSTSNDLLYELMSVEAALVCISTLLWFCPEALIYDENCLLTIVDGLENAFRAIKGKYQPKFRTHFRFRALHVILLECFAWLPPGSFPNTCQQLFVEALRVFRDSISSSHETTCLADFVSPGFAILNAAGISKPVGNTGWDIPLTEGIMMLKLEQNARALQKKESEAFLAAFTKDVRWSDFHRQPVQTSSWTEPSPPCAHIESRTVDAAIALLAATFGHQNNEYQEKAMQLCSQAVSQFLKSGSSLGIFSSEDEKRRKEKKGYITVKNVICALSAIVRSFPFHSGMSLDLDLIWVQSVADRMLEILLYPNVDIRSAAAKALGLFCSKIYGSALMENVSSKISSSIRAALEKKSESMNDCLGYLVALASLWEHCKDMPDIQHSLSSVLFDCLKKSECSISFRAFSVFALSLMIKNKEIGESVQDVTETLKMISRVCLVAETQISLSGPADSSNTNYEFDLLLVCLQRLINNTVPLLMDLDPTSSMMTRFTRLWDVIRNCSSNIYLAKECTDFIVSVSLFPVGVLQLDRSEVALFLKQALELKGSSSCSSLLAAVEGVRALMLQDAESACQAGLDVELFKLLDWCIASSSVMCASPYWGLELRPELEGALGSMRTLQRSIELVLDALISIEVKQYPDTRAARWVLLCRAVALGLRIAGTADEDNAKDAGPGEGEGEADFGFSAATATASKTAAGGGVGVTVPGMTYIQFSARTRDAALQKAQGIIATRVRVKCVAVQCATTALRGVMTSPPHNDLSLAREASKAKLDELGPSPDEAALESLPCFTALFLHDIINFACASATYSIEDHRLLSLQAASMELLETIVNMFWHCADPDETSADMVSAATGVVSTPRNRILQQFISQIVSAIRTCLTAQWHPVLLNTAGELASDLIRGGFLEDKIVVRRVAKLLLPTVAQSGEATAADSTSLSLTTRAMSSLLVADEVSTIQHLVGILNVARLFLLTTTAGPYKDVRSESRAALLGLLDEHLDTLTRIWFALAVDAVRVFQGERQWPKATDKTDPRSGGLTYAPYVDLQSLVSHFELALPFVVTAVSLSPKLQQHQIIPIFAISQILLDHLKYATATNPSGNSSLMVDHNSSLPGSGSSGGSPLSSKSAKLDKRFYESLIFATFSSLAKNHNIGFAAIGVSQWNTLLTYILLNIIPAHAADFSGSTNQSTAMCDFIHMVLDIVEPLLHTISSQTISSATPASASAFASVPEEGGQELLNTLRITILSFILSVFDKMFEGKFDLFSLQSDGSPPSSFPIPDIMRCPSVPFTVDDAARIQEVVSKGVLARLILCLSACCKDEETLDLRIFTVKLLTALIPYLSLLVPSTMAARSAILNLINQQLVLLIQNNKNNSSSEVSDSAVVTFEDISLLLAADLDLWQEAYSKGNTALTISVATTTTASEGAKKLPPSTVTATVTALLPAADAAIGGLVESLLAAWAVITKSIEGGVPSVTQFSAIILHPEMYREFSTALVTVALRYLQVDARGIGVKLMAQIFPAVLCYLGKEEVQESVDLIAAYELLVLQLVFLVFTLVGQEQRGVFIGCILTPLCGYLSRRSLDSQCCLFCSKGITHLARLCPEIFREKVGAMSDAAKTTLQNAMRLVLEQQSSAEKGNLSNNIDGSSGSGGGIKKIDISRYKRN